MSSKEMGLLTRAGKTSASTEYKLRTYYIDIYEMIEFLCGFLGVPFPVSEFARPSGAAETFPASFTIEDKGSSFCREKACQKLRDTRLNIEI